MPLLRWLPRFRAAYRAMNELEAREQWSRAEIEAFQLDRLNALWAHATAHSPYYRALANSAGLPPRFCSLTEFRALVPVLSKETVRDRPRDVLAEAPPTGHWDCTSGSTGVPTRVFWQRDAHWEMLRVKYRFLASWGLDIFDRTAYLWSTVPAVASGLSACMARGRQRISDWLRNRIRLPACRLGRNELRTALRRIEAFGPASLYAYTSAAYMLAQEAEATGFRCPALRAVVLSGEPSSPAISRRIKRAFGVPVTLEYGSVECGFIAGMAADATLRVREDVVLVETHPRPDGRFQLLVSVLNNPAFPLLRYDLGDLTCTALHTPARGFSVLDDVAGRSCDLLVCRSGRYLHWNEVLYAIEHAPQVRRFRAHQHADGRLTVLVEATAPASKWNTGKLARQLVELLEGFAVGVQVVDVLPPEVNHKHRWLSSDRVAAVPYLPAEFGPVQADEASAVIRGGGVDRGARVAAPQGKGTTA
jgi:phenylacetate-CoA ligase